MRIRKHIPTLIALTAVLTLGVSLYVNHNKPRTEINAAQVNENFAPYTYSGSYYSDHNIDFSAGDGMNGALRTKLRTELKPKGFVDYSSGLSTHCQQADEDPSNTNNMILFYTRDSVKKQAAGTWNREHVWPKNKSNGNWGTSQGGTDILHLRPTYVTPNSTRSNHPYGYAHSGSKLTHNGMDYGWLNGDIFEPLDCVKGDAARIIMYMWTVYDGYSGYSPLSITSVFESYNTLLEWHTMDKPDAMEGHRNDYVQTTIQKNRNPFVDHPELAWKIFGDQASSSVKAACMAAYPANGGTPVQPTGISLNKATASVQVGKTTQLNASLEPYGATGTVTWTSNNTSVATVNSTGLVTGKAVGEAIVTATCGTYSASCTVTVAEAVNIYGTQDDPLTVSEARQLIDDGNTSEKMYVKGIVSSSKYSSQYDNFDYVWLKNEKGDEDHYFELYHVNMDGSTENYRSDDALKDKEVVAYGYGKKYNSTYELAPNGNDKPVILSVTDPSAPEKTPREIIEATETATTLSYRYTKESSGSASFTDTLTAADTGITSSSYGDWTANGDSGVSYAGYSAYGNSSIQLKSKNNVSGIVVSSNTDGIKAISVSVVWNSSTPNGKILKVYGKNSAYDDPSDLYGSDAGTSLGSIKYGTSTSLTITGDYEYIGVKSDDGAIWLSSFSIQWGGSAATYEYSDASIRFGGLLTQDLWNDLDTEDHVITGFGVMITAVSSYVSGASKIKEQYQSAVLSTNEPDVTESLVNYYVSKESMATPVEDDDNYFWNLFYRISDLKKVYVAAAYIKTSTDYVFFKQVKYSAKTLAADYIANRGCGPTTAAGSLANLASL